MSVSSAVFAVVDALPEVERQGWRAQLAVTLAESLDEVPNASMARELRAVMKELQEVSSPVEEDGVDKIISLANRRSASSG